MTLGNPVNLSFSFLICKMKIIIFSPSSYKSKVKSSESAKQMTVVVTHGKMAQTMVVFRAFENYRQFKVSKMR